MGKYCITQDLTNYKSDTQISQNCLKKTWFSAAKMLHRLLQPVSRETFFVVIYRIAAVFTVFFAVYFLFFRLYGKFFLAMEQKKLLVIVNGNYQRIMDCREAFRPNRPKKRLRWNIWSKYNEWNGSCDFVIYYQRLKYFTLPFYSLSRMGRNAISTSRHLAFCTCYFYIPGSVCTMSLFIRCHTRSYLTTSHARTWKIPYPGLYVMIYTLFLRVVRFLSYICLIFNCHNILSWAIVILFFYTFLIIVIYMSRFILSTAFVILILVIILPPFIT